MKYIKFNTIFRIIIIIIIFQCFLSAKISEKDLKRYNSFFLAKILNDNNSLKLQIRRCLNGIVKSETGGIRILDKFGLFIYDCNKNNVQLKKVKFFYKENINHFFLVLKDKNDNQLYNLYLEYGYDYQKRSYYLKDIYFCLVFNEKMKEIEKFFKYR